MTARLIDRPIRPMFAEGFRNEVQVINTVLSYDENASAPMAAMFGSSLALSISDIPFNGPIAGVQVAYAAEDFIINPSAADKGSFTFRLDSGRYQGSYQYGRSQVLRNCQRILCCKHS